MLQSSHTLFRRTLLMGCALVWGIAGIQASVLTDFLAALEQQTLQSDFTITVSEEVSQPMNYPGSITMQGNRFRLAMFDTEAAYDGNTLYIYSASTDELTLSKPTESELLEANPFLYAKALVEVCTISERPAKDPAQTIITLTPKDQSVGIQRFTLRLRRTDKGGKTQYLPMSVEIKEGKQLTTLTLKNPQYIATPPAFRLDYPDAYLNDLR